MSLMTPLINIHHTQIEEEKLSQNSSEEPQKLYEPEPVQIDELIKDVYRIYQPPFKKLNSPPQKESPRSPKTKNSIQIKKLGELIHKSKVNEASVMSRSQSRSKSERRSEMKG